MSYLATRYKFHWNWEQASQNKIGPCLQFWVGKVSRSLTERLESGQEDRCFCEPLWNRPEAVLLGDVEFEIFNHAIYTAMSDFDLYGWNMFQKNTLDALTKELNWMKTNVKAAYNYSTLNNACNHRIYAGDESHLSLKTHILQLTDDFLDMAYEATRKRQILWIIGY